MKKPGTRLEVWQRSKEPDVWYVDLWLWGQWVVSLVNRRGIFTWPSRNKAKAQADRFSKALGGIPVVVDE